MPLNKTEDLTLAHVVRPTFLVRKEACPEAIHSISYMSASPLNLLLDINYVIIRHGDCISFRVVSGLFYDPDKLIQLFTDTSFKIYIFCKFV